MSTRTVGPRARWWAAPAMSLALAVAPAAALAQKVAPITIVINQSPWFGGFAKVGRGLREGDRQQGQPRRQPVRRQRREAAQLGAREGGPVRPAGDELDLARRVLPRRLPRAAERDRPGVQARPAGDQLRRHRLLGPEDARRNNAKTGVVYGVPINGNIQVLYYRADLYEKAGLKVPTTWDELLANARKLHNPPNDLRHRAARRAQRVRHLVRLDAVPPQPQRRDLQGREDRRLHRHAQQPGGRSRRSTSISSSRRARARRTRAATARRR